jgi:hypothetical protein
VNNELTQVKTAARTWFSAGVVATAVVLAAFSIFLVWNAASALLAVFAVHSQDSRHVSRIQPLVPGVNVPMADTFMLISAVALSAVLVRLP